eukprot:gene8575-9488_t
MAMKLKAATKFIKISHPEESLAAAPAYLKGPDYAENRPIPVNVGLVIDARGPKRQLFQDVIDTLIAETGMKLFEGCSGRLDVQKAMQHVTLVDAVSVGVKYVIDKIHGANTDEEFHQAILDTEVQIVLDGSQWDRSTPIQGYVIPLLFLYVLLVEEEAASDPMAAAGDEALSPTAVLELLEAEADKLDSDSTFILDILQEFAFETQKLLKFLTGSLALPSRGLPKRNVTVSFLD